MASIERAALTIAIPSYNRNETLKRNLAFLLPQLLNNVRVVIYDNHSDVPVSDTLRLELEEYPQIQVVRNVANIGACANVVRCIEFCETDWVWILSDDDEPHKNAIETILKYIVDYPDLYYANFKSNYTLQRNENIYATGANEFIEKADNIHNLFLISLGLYNVKAIRPYIKFAYLFSYSLVPHFVLLLMSLKDSGKVIFSKDFLISSQGVHVDPNKSWSYFPLCLGLPTLVELPINLTPESYSKISGFIKKEIITRPSTSLERVLSLYKKENISVLKYNFSQPYLRLDNGLTFIWKLEYFFCLIVLNIPVLIPLFLFTINRVRKIIKKPGAPFATDRFNRI